MLPRIGMACTTEKGGIIQLRRIIADADEIEITTIGERLIRIFRDRQPIGASKAIQLAAPPPRHVDIAAIIHHQRRGRNIRTSIACPERRGPHNSIQR